MKDGVYELQFSADGYNGLGEMVLKDNRGKGQDEKVRIEGHLMENRSSLSAVVNVLMAPATLRNARVPAHYSLTMTGTADDGGFSLIGIGPIGIIVDLKGTWRGPLDDEVVE